MLRWNVRDISKNDIIYRIRKNPRGKPIVVYLNRLAPYESNNPDSLSKPRGGNASNGCKTNFKFIQPLQGFITRWNDVHKVHNRWTTKRLIRRTKRVSKSSLRQMKKFGILKDYRHFGQNNVRSDLVGSGKTVESPRAKENISTGGAENKTR